MGNTGLAPQGATGAAVLFQTLDMASTHMSITFGKKHIIADGHTKKKKEK